jgi:hypothetical protein
VIFIIYKFISVWKYGKSILNGLGHEQCGPYHSELAPHFENPTVTRQWYRAGDPMPRCGSAGPVSCRPTVTDVRDRDHSLSLCSTYKKEKAGRSFLPGRHFSPNIEVRPTSARCRLAADWSGHWTIPFA